MRVVKVLLILTLGTSTYVVWAAATDRELVWPISAVLRDQEVSGSDPDFHDLQVSGESGSPFVGTVTVANPAGDFQDVIVTVDVFDGDQNVGELTGSVTLKPRSESSVELVSMDEYESWSDAHVDLLRLPK